MRVSPRLFAVGILGLLAAWSAWSYLDGGILSILFDSRLDAIGKLEATRSLLAEWGPLAPVAYVLFVTVEVIVAPVPGTLLYLPGGAIFGGFLGGLLSLLGNVLGAGISCTLMRSLVGREWTRSFFTRTNLEKYEGLIEKHGILVILALRVNPLTSSDLVSYAAGLTRISTGKVMLGTLIGMAPLCFLQSYLSETLLTTFPWLIWPLVVGCVLYVGVVSNVLWRLRAQKA